MKLPPEVNLLATAHYLQALDYQKKANQVVTVGIFASFFSLLIILAASAVPSTEWSPVGDDTFDLVFGATAVAVFASMMAYLLAQYIDITIFHFWKRVTKGKHLWLRNNFSTFTSQFVDTATVLFLLCSFGKIEWPLFGGLLLSGFLFKVLVAALDTPLLYLATYALRRMLGLKFAEEITKASSKQTYHTIRLFADRERRADAYRAYAYFRWVDDVLDALLLKLTRNQ